MKKLLLFFVVSILGFAEFVSSRIQCEFTHYVIKDGEVGWVKSVIYLQNGKRTPAREDDYATTYSLTLGSFLITIVESDPTFLRVGDITNDNQVIFSKKLFFDPWNCMLDTPLLFKPQDGLRVHCIGDL